MSHQMSLLINTPYHPTGFSDSDHIIFVEGRPVYYYPGTQSWCNKFKHGLPLEDAYPINFSPSTEPETTEPETPESDSLSPKTESILTRCFIKYEETHWDKQFERTRKGKTKNKHNFGRIFSIIGQHKKKHCIDKKTHLTTYDVYKAKHVIRSTTRTRGLRREYSRKDKITSQNEGVGNEYSDNDDFYNYDEYYDDYGDYYDYYDEVYYEDWINEWDY